VRILYVDVDTLRADHLGCYGYEAETTPHLDAFARRSLVFDQAYSTTSLTHPALSAMMTGRMPDEIGMAGGNRQHMPDAVTTLAEVLHDAGVATAAVVSNWVLRVPDDAPGTGIAQGFEDFDARMDVRELNRDAFERTAPATTDAAIAWMRGRSAEAPFFLWVHYQDPHGPYVPPEELVRPVAEQPGERRLKVGKTHSGYAQLPSYQVLGEERQPAYYRARYDGEIRYFDREVGRLFDWLAGQGWLDDTLIVFTADHGESLGEHDFWFCHGESLARELVHVPFLLHAPSLAPGRTAMLAGHLDVFATVLAALHVPAPASRGRNLLAPAPGAERVLVQTLFQRDAITRLDAVSDGRWHLIEQRKRTLLFDLAADPGERTNLASENPDVVHELKRAVKQFWKARPGPEVEAGPEMPLDAQAAEALKQLGYLDGEEPK